jgi:hypothetical protein
MRVFFGALTMYILALICLLRMIYCEHKGEKEKAAISAAVCVGVSIGTTLGILLNI